MLGFASVEQAFPSSTLPHAADGAPAGLTSSSSLKPACRVRAGHLHDDGLPQAGGSLLPDHEDPKTQGQK